MMGDMILRKMSDKRLAELVASWAAEEAGAQTEDERRVCRRMLAKYQGEIERRHSNGRGSESD